MTNQGTGASAMTTIRGRRRLVAWSKKRYRLILAVVPLALAAFVVPAAISPSAAFAATCYGGSCSGQNPSAAGCYIDAYAVDYATTGGVYIYLMYSPTCNANWVEMDNAQAFWHATVYNNAGASQDTTAWPGQSTTYSNMVDGSFLAWACFDNGVCTGAH